LRLRASVPSNGSRVKMLVPFAKKEKIVDKLRSELDQSYFLAGIDYKGFSVKDISNLRRALPEETTLMVTKNTYLNRAIGDDEKWNAIEPILKGPNAWLFVKSEEPGKTIKAVNTFTKDLNLPNEYVGGVLDGQFVEPTDFSKIEKMPTKKELYAKMAGGIKAIPTKLGVGVAALPRKVAYAVKAISEKEEGSEA